MLEYWPMKNSRKHTRHQFILEVDTPDCISRLQAFRMVDILLDIGIADAEATLEHNEGDLEFAERVRYSRFILNR